MRTKRIAILTLVVFALIFLPMNAFAEQSVSSLVKKVQPAIVLINIYDAQGNQVGQGSGFFVGQKGEIITNWHVINNAASAVVKTATGAMFNVKGIVVKDEKKDITKIVLEPKDVIFPYLTLASTLPAVGERIVVVGSPFGLESTVSDGLVSAIRKIPDVGNIIQISAPISPGSSGSPVINENGQVVGVASFQLVKGQNLNFAVSALDVAALQSGRQAVVTPLPQKTVGAINPEVQLKENGWIKIVKTFEDTRTREERNPELFKALPGEFKKAIFRTLDVKIQFLKRCNAKTKVRDITDKGKAKRGISKDQTLFLNPDVKGGYTPEEEKAFIISLKISSFNDAVRKGDTKKQEDIISALNKEYPDHTDWTFPRFNCDYRNKVFATFFSSEGHEVDTKSRFPNAKFIRSGEDEIKTEMLPGETMWIGFHIPDDASSWVVWVPK